MTDSRAALVANYLEKTGVLTMISDNILAGGQHGADADAAFLEDHETRLERYLKGGEHRSARDADAPTADERAELQDDFESAGVTSFKQFMELAVDMPETVIGILRGEFEERGTDKQRACLLMLGWQLGCELTEWHGGPKEHFALYEGTRRENLEDVEAAYRLACAIARVEPLFV